MIVVTTLFGSDTLQQVREEHVRKRMAIKQQRREQRQEAREQAGMWSFLNEIEREDQAVLRSGKCGDKYPHMSPGHGSRLIGESSGFKKKV